MKLLTRIRWLVPPQWLRLHEPRPLAGHGIYDGLYYTGIHYSSKPLPLYLAVYLTIVLLYGMLYMIWIHVESFRSGLE